MDLVEFMVRGSAPDPYRVVFVRQGEDLEAHCSCPAGEMGRHCKHRLRILRGELGGIEAGNADQVELVQQWLSGSSLAQALEDLDNAERESERAKRVLSLAKKTVAKAMRSGTI